MGENQWPSDTITTSKFSDYKVNGIKQGENENYIHMNLNNVFKNIQGKNQNTGNRFNILVSKYLKFK